MSNENKELDDAFEIWKNSREGKLCLEDSILHLHKYQDVLEARLRAAFVAGARSCEQNKAEERILKKQLGTTITLARALSRSLRRAAPENPLPDIVDPQLRLIKESLTIGQQK